MIGSSQKGTLRSRKNNHTPLVRIIWTKHAEERLTQWKRQRGITRNEIEEAVRDPDQVVSGRGDALVAQKRRRNGLLRVPYVSEEEGNIILTLYWTSKANKYWREEADENNL
jgi:hypothetical protein